MSRYVGVARGRTPAETIARASEILQGRAAPGSVPKPPTKRYSSSYRAPARPAPREAATPSES